VPRLVNTDGVTWTKFGPEVPPLVLTAQLVPAGSHRAKSVLDDLRRAHTEGLCADAVVDAGYSLSAAEYFHIPLRQAGIDLTMQPVTHQRGGKPGTGPAREIDGHLFAEQMPEELVNLDANDTETFVRRAPYHYSRIKAPGKDGSTRWEHPLHAGTLRSREVPRSMRRPLHVPLIEVEDGADLSTLTAGAGALPMWQRCLFGEL